MLNTKKQKLASAIQIALFVSAATLVSGTAFAQEESKAKDLDRIEVTGSRIRSVDAETSQPVLVLDRESIEKQGLTSVAEVLQRVSANGAAINRTFNNGGDGSANVSLRNLGAARTLVLVDGRRWVTGLDGTVDLNTIPSSIIERVEVLKDGASAVYGSDAVAGAINIITRNNYEGAEFRSHFGQFNQGDGQRKTADATVGVNGERGNVVFNVAYVNEGEVMAGNRYVSREPVYGLGSTRYSGFSASGRIWNGGLVLPDNAVGQGPAGQQRYALDQFVPFSNDYRYNFAPDNYLLTPQTRTSAYVKGRYDLSEKVAFRAEALYNERRSEQQLAGYPLHDPALFGEEAASLSEHSYFNPYNTLWGGDGRKVLWSHRLTEQPRVYQQNVKTFHVYAGLDGVFDIGERAFAWEVGYAFNKNDQTDRQIGDVNMRNLRLAVGPSELRNGKVVCVDAPGGNVIEGCVPFNPLTPARGVSPEMLNYLLFTAQDVFQNRSEVFSANISGDMFQLPGGMAGFALGYEQRKESGFDSPDAFVAAGYSSGNGRKPTAGGYDLKEVYGEVLLPLLADKPFADLLEFSLASRYSDYSNFGDTTNSKFGFKWKPYQDLLVRGSWAQGFRAPSITNLYRGLADSYSAYGDTCSLDNPNRTATIAANCLSAGVPAGYVQYDGYGAQTPVPFSVGGNPNVGPEKSISKTLGLVYSPSFAKGLDIKLDWWNIRIEDALSTPSGGYILDQCYTGKDTQYCNLFTRDATGLITRMLLVPQNLANYNVEGWDLNVNYRLPETSYGKFTVSLDAAYLSKHESRLSADVPYESNVGIYTDRDPTWRLRSNASLDWSYRDFGVTWMSRYHSRLVEDCKYTTVMCSDPNRITAEGPAPRNAMGATTYHDIQARMSLPWNGTVKIGVNNIFKKNAPHSSQAFANSFDPQYDIPDSRYWYFEYVQKF